MNSLLRWRCTPKIVGIQSLVLMFLLLFGHSAAAECIFELSSQKFESTASQSMILGNDGIPRTALGDWVPIYSRSTTDRIRIYGAPIGRLDVCWETATGDSIITYCTANLLKGNKLLTNFHCTDQRLLEKTRFSEAVISEMRLLLGYDDIQDTSKALSYRVDLEPLRASKSADAILLNVLGDPNKKWGAIELHYVEDFAPDDALTVIHHPASMTKMFNPIRCSIHASQDIAESNQIRHVCDTASGSSGTLLLRESDLAILGLHHAGGLRAGDQNTFNYGIDFKFVASELELELLPSEVEERGGLISNFYLATYPQTVSPGDEISLIADVPENCDAKFFSMSPSIKVTPIPTDFFTVHEFANGYQRHEISAATRFGLLIEEKDPPGKHLIGFVCSDDKDVNEILRIASLGLSGGALSKTNFDGELIFGFSIYEIID